MSILKAVMVGFRGWNSFLVAPNMYVFGAVCVGAGHGQPCGKSTLHLMFAVNMRSLNQSDLWLETIRENRGPFSADI